jgi:hypothetical protein
MTLRSLTGACGLFLAVAVLGNMWEHSGTVTLEPKLSRSAFASGPMSQKQHQRRWLTPRYSLDWRVAADHTRLEKSVLLKLNHDGRLFAADLATNRIIEISQHGELLKNYILPPRPATQLADFSFDDSGRLLAADRSGRRIYVYDTADGQLIESMTTLPRPTRIASAHGNIFMLSPYPRHHLFWRLSAGLKASSFGQLVRDTDETQLALDGWLGCAQGRIVYAAMHAGLVAAFDLGGRPLYLRETIDPSPLPPVIKDHQGNFWVSHEYDRGARNMSVDETGLFHLFVTVRRGSSEIGAIDTYRGSDGEYLYSRRLPEPARQIWFSQANAYTVSNGQIAKWTINL